MAVVDIYSNSELEAGKKSSALISTGAQSFVVMATVSVASGDDDGSVYRIFKDIPASVVPVEICIHNTAMTSSTDWDLGLYASNNGAVVDKDILADGLDMSSARTIATWNNAGLTTLTLSNGAQDLGTLSAQTDPYSAYDIALTANTVGSAAGTIRVTARFAYL